jgi:hypothetical protein
MSPIIYVPHPADPDDPTMGYFATWVRKEDEAIPLLLTDHEFLRAAARAQKREGLLPQRPVAVTGVRRYPRTWFHRLLIGLLPSTP